VSSGRPRSQDRYQLYEAGGSARCRSIAEWEMVRPNHPHLPDPKTGQLVSMLFCWRGRRLPCTYINTSLIPALCKKAGVPERDARGRITGHRARHTIASQLYNAKEPMSLHELQTWLGHRSPVSTQYYV
jgi:integrase